MALWAKVTLISLGGLVVTALTFSVWFVFQVVPIYFEYLSWTIEVTKIERPSQAESRYGTLRNLGRGQFEDDLVKIDAGTKDPMEAFFVLTNKTEYDLNIDWRRAKFVDIYRRTHPVAVMPLQLSFEYPPEGHTRDDGMLTEIKPAHSARIRVSPPGRPQIRGLWAWEMWGIEGKTLKVSLPLQVEGKSYDYVFTFQIARLKASM